MALSRSHREASLPRVHDGRVKLDAGGYVHVLYIHTRAAAVERAAVRATAPENKVIATKVKKLGLPNPDLIRRGASVHEPTRKAEDPNNALGRQ